MKNIVFYVIGLLSFLFYSFITVYTYHQTGIVFNWLTIVFGLMTYATLCTVILHFLKNFGKG